MREVKILPPGALGYDFVPKELLPPGEDENYLRNRQVGKPANAWRHLRSDEIEVLVKNGVTCDNWDNFFVGDPFTPQLIRNSEFSGLIRIGKLENVVLEHHELKTPAGITNSLVISCDVGDNAAVHNVRYLSHYIIGDNAILLNIDEMNTTNHAKFGNGIVKEGEPERVRVWLNLMNEAGGRAVLPFDGMTAADAYLWARYRDDPELLERLKEITQRQFDARRGFYGMVGDAAVVKNSRVLKDVRIGPRCYIKGANKLKNLSINSSDDEPTQIGEGVELVNGVIGFGCHVFYGCKAVRFVMGNNSKLTYGARLIHSYLGDNSTVSCCEILNNLVFPAHEQHHNNSFLVASLVMGQSNIAAGATLGSNHNSRANDGEIRAGRGFWPGLCTTLKHSSKFASFVLLAKGDYPAELNVPLPFSLVADDPAGGRLVVLPAYWWLHNMYALARNTWKFVTRDKRKTKTQHVEFEALAPDTAEEIFAALDLLETWTGQSYHRKHPGKLAADRDWTRRLGRDYLSGPEDRPTKLEVIGEGVENSRRKVVILKPWHAWQAYRQMLHHYAVSGLLDYLADHPASTPESLFHELGGPRQRNWVNLGGQLVPAEDVDTLRTDIRSGKLDSWPKIHARYDQLWQQYPRARQRHALATLADLLGIKTLNDRVWNDVVLDEAVQIQQLICNRVYESRKKDYENPFRMMTFENPAEMEAVLGTAEGNSFVTQVREETEAFRRRIETARR